MQSQSTDHFQTSDQLQINRQLGDFWLTWTIEGILEVAPSLWGPWISLNNAVSPFAISISQSPEQYFRVRPAGP